MTATPSQKAYINALYNKLSIGYKDRIMPSSTIEASALIRDLKEQVENMMDNAMEGEYDHGETRGYRRASPY
jgi:hypothetical protein